MRIHNPDPINSKTHILDPDILKINFKKKENNKNFWFISKNKEEPRIADRFEEQGSDLEQPLAIARDIKKLYDRCLNLARHKLSRSFLAFISFIDITTGLYCYIQSFRIIWWTQKYAFIPELERYGSSNRHTLWHCIRF